MESKNYDTLREFMRYCQDHPEQRFWQALCNWSGFFKLYGAKLEDYEDDFEDLYYRLGK